MNPETVLQNFKEHRLALNMSERTIDGDAVLLRKFFDYLEYEGIENLTDVDTEVLLKYQIYVSALRTKKGELYSPATRKRHLTVVGVMFQYLWLKGEVFYNPVSKLERIKVPKQLPAGILSIEEVQTLLDQPDISTWLGLRDRAIMEVFYSTAMRRNELINLDLLDLYPDRKTMHIRQGKYLKDRVVPCGRVAWKWLSKYLEEARPLRIANPDEQAVFINQHGCRLGQQGIKTLMDKYGKQASISKSVTPHIFRHTCATHMHDNGASIRRLQEILGHESIETTARYIRVSIVKLKQTHKQCHPREMTAEKIA
ncbi:hypothetical protein BVX97_02635 [bacterium E08(2017)]|nr:hypothetical protein BVX97_02635 [bacterium E08(2017)]